MWSIKQFWTSQGRRKDICGDDSRSCPCHSELQEWLVANDEGRMEAEGPLSTFWVRPGPKRSYWNFILHPLGPPLHSLTDQETEKGSHLSELRQSDVSKCAFHSTRAGTSNLACWQNSGWKMDGWVNGCQWRVRTSVFDIWIPSWLSGVQFFFPGLFSVEAYVRVFVSLEFNIGEHSILCFLSPEVFISVGPCQIF